MIMSRRSKRRVNYVELAGGDEAEEAESPSSRVVDAAPLALPALAQAQNPPIDVLEVCLHLFPERYDRVRTLFAAMAPQNRGVPQPLRLWLDYRRDGVQHVKDISVLVDKFHGFGVGTVREPRIETEVIVLCKVRCSCNSLERSWRKYLFLWIVRAEPITRPAFDTSAAVECQCNWEQHQPDED